MKFGTVMLTIFFSVCALYGIVWLGHLQPISVKEDELRKQLGVQPAPEVEVSGPQPKAVADETMFMFGQSIVGTENSHVFILRNEGEAPLVLEKGDSTCDCTVSSLEEGKALKVLPGKSVEITLTWNPKRPDELFHHSADIITNDPNLRVVKFEIEGEVVVRVSITPSDPWVMPDMLDTTSTKFTGYIGSVANEDFQIEKITTSNPLLAFKHFKVGETELAELRLKYGYRIDLELKQGVPVGPFNETLTIVTNIKDVDAFIVNVRSHRYGPITIRSIKKNSLWNAAKMGLNMGSFAATDGRISTLHLYVKIFGDKDLEFHDIEVDPEFLKFTFTPDDSFTGKGSKRHLITFEIPPGSPKSIRQKQSPALVHLKTNHPDVPEMKFLIHFISR